MELTKQAIVDLLAINDRAVARALVAINARQTADEQAAKVTAHSNGMGFTGVDASIGTSCAEFYTRTGFLTPKQLAFWRKADKRGTMRIAKYAGQLLIVAQEKAKAAA